MDIDQMMAMANKYADDANFYKQGLERVIKEREDEEEIINAFNDDVDPVNNPAHYADKNIEVINYIDDTVPDSYSFYFGNALKYLSRHMKKGSEVQDLEKCKWYIDRMIKDWKS